MKGLCEVFGIDLGTTNSCIAALKDGVPHIVPVGGCGIVPSVVSMDGCSMLVGRKARNRASAFPEQSVRSIKRLMGSSETCLLGRKEYSPEDISSIILRYLCDEAERIEGVKIERVVITVPAYFNDAQRRATREAGNRAGLKVERIINEPTAAALLYDQILSGEKNQKKKAQERFILVYDLGGGTFDVTVLRAGEIVEVLSSTGDTRLGGDDFDNRIVCRLLETIRAESNVNLEGHLPSLARLSAAAETAKIDLSSKAYTWIRENHLPTPYGSTCSVEMELFREEFESMTVPLLKRTRELVLDALSEASLKPKQIDNVLLVGGMTRMPAVVELVADIFGDAPLPAIDPDRSVACGAAIQGALITGSHVDQILIDVTPHTLSVEALTGNNPDDLHPACVPIIPRNTQLPVMRARTFSTLQKNQRIAEVKIFQGESPIPEENTLLGATTLSLAKAPGGSPVIIEYAYDLDGIVRISAEHKGYSRKKEIRIDSRDPQVFIDLDTDGFTGEENDDSREGGAPLINFVTARARALLERMPKGAHYDELSSLLSRYEEALSNESEDLENIEDQLLCIMEKISESGWN